VTVCSMMFEVLLISFFTVLLLNNPDVALAFEPSEELVDEEDSDGPYD
jgi:hypothetical protein